MITTVASADIKDIVRKALNKRLKLEGLVHISKKILASFIHNRTHFVKYLSGVVFTQWTSMCKNNVAHFLKKG